MLRLNVTLTAFFLLFLIPFRSDAVLVITGGSWTSNGLPATVTDPDITISGTFVIDVNATFNNCPDIKMAAGAQIIVDDGIIFTADRSHFYTAGDYIWKGISMRGSSLSGGFIKMTLTTLEDAYCAINGIDWVVGANQSNFSFELYGMRFNRNFISLRKGSTSDTYLTGAINIVHSAEVTCVDNLDATSPVPVNLKSGAPYTKPQNGFSFQQVDEIFLGHLHPVSGHVNFSYLNNGIFARHCKLNVVTSNFTEIRTYDTYDPAYASIPESYGVGLYAYFTWNIIPSVVRYFLPYYKVTGCDFTNGETGICSRDAQDVAINFVKFKNLDIATRFIGWKVRTPFPQPSKFTITGSDIKNCNQGIDGLSNSQVATTITDNTIQVNFPAITGSARHSNTAISINPVTPAVSGTTIISGNTISGGKTGIELNMVEKASVTGNTIHFTNYLSYPGPVLTSPTRHGIYIFGGQANDVRANSIKGTAGLYTSGLIGPAHLGTGYEVQHGLTAIGSPANSITCNNTGELYSAFHFGGANFNTNLGRNNLETGRNFVTGLFMEAWGTGGAVISQQGVSGGAAHFNEFNGNYNYPGGYKTVCDGGTDGSRSRFIYIAGSTPTPTPNWGINPITISGTASTAITSTPCAPPLRLTGKGNTGSQDEPIDAGSLDWALAIAADSLYGAEPFTPFLRFQGQSFLYAYLAQRPALRTASTELDAFYTATLGSPVALLYEADSITRTVGTDSTAAPGADSTRLAAAITVLQGINPQLPFAGLEAELRRLTLGKLLADSADYDSTERTRLEYIAALCPGAAGMGVYLARNLVRNWSDTVYSDDSTCSGSGGFMRTTASNMRADGLLPAAAKSSLQSNIVPNPAIGTTRLFVSEPLDHNTEIRLYDLNGRVVHHFTLPKGTGQHSINISNIPAGIYFYTNEDARIKGKLIVR